MQLTFEQRSSLPVSAGEVWSRATTPEGINDELFPWLRMTVPDTMRGKTIDQLPLDQRLGRSWLLAMCVFPVDFDDITLAEVGPGCRFRETSRMLAVSSWVHERTVRDITGGCEVLDRLTFELRRPGERVPGWQATVTALLKFLFRHRHARLARWAAKTDSSR